MFLTTQPCAHGRFRRAIERRALWMVEGRLASCRTCRPRTRWRSRCRGHAYPTKKCRSIWRACCSEGFDICNSDAFDELQAQGHPHDQSGGPFGRLSADGRLYVRSETAEWAAIYGLAPRHEPLEPPLSSPRRPSRHSIEGIGAARSKLLRTEGIYGFEGGGGLLVWRLTRPAASLMSRSFSLSMRTPAAAPSAPRVFVSGTDVAQRQKMIEASS